MNTFFYNTEHKKPKFSECFSYLLPWRDIDHKLVENEHKDLAKAVRFSLALVCHDHKMDDLLPHAFVILKNLLNYNHQFLESRRSLLIDVHDKLNRTSEQVALPKIFIEDVSFEERLLNESDFDVVILNFDIAGSQFHSQLCDLIKDKRPPKRGKRAKSITPTVDEDM